MGTNVEPPKTSRMKNYHKLITEYYDKDIAFWNDYLVKNGDVAL